MERRQAHSFFRSRLRRATTLSRGDRDPSRRSTVAVFGCGPTKPAPGSGTGAAATARATPSRPGGRGPDLPALRFAPQRGTPLPAPPSGSSPETPLMSEDGDSYISTSICSQYINSHRSSKKQAFNGKSLLPFPVRAVLSAVIPGRRKRERHPAIGVKECLGKADGMSEQSLAKIEALGQRHVQTRIEHEMSTACFPRICARHGKQSRPDAITSKLLMDNQVVDKDEAPIQEIFLQPIANDPDNSAVTPRCRQTISLFALTHHLANERAGILQVRA